jgi:HD-GYP domain-containing protein (c-di-GMP phosphodiesterase class II)
MPGSPLLIHASARPDALMVHARAAGWRVACVDPSDELQSEAVGRAALFIAASDSEAERFRLLCPQAVGVGIHTAGGHVDVVLSEADWATNASRLLNLARRVAELHDGDDARDVRLSRRRMRQLADIGIALSAQRDPTQLLTTILSEARRLANCDAGSIYLVDEKGGDRSLQFRLAQNDTIAVSVAETRLPVTAASLAGYVALTGCELNITDAYEIQATAPYQFNRSFDEQSGYRTKSLLVLPMSDHKGRIIGVLQFINRLAASGEPIDFDDEVVELLRAVASQAAVAIQKNVLLQQVSQLFESFVLASVKAIEQRDPSTSGHSFRVAETTTALFLALPLSGLPRFRNLVISQESLTEVRYAALLHDFGKVGVRERVLLKANKLSEERLEVLRYRFELQKERLRRDALEREMHALHVNPADFELTRRRIKRELERAIVELDDYFDAIRRANNPNIRAEGRFEHLDLIRASRFVELDGTHGGLINDDDVAALSVRRGSLTPAERREIEAHVALTQEFLAFLPWPSELARVPAIAGAHHEKLDGSGYPRGLRDAEIPLPSRVMTVCDIFDALTAMDRSYKSAVAPDAAFRILDEEASAGLIDADLVRIFIDSGAYRAAQRHGKDVGHPAPVELR